MVYLGGKAKIAEALARAIRSRVKPGSRLLEPFVGGGSVHEWLAPHFGSVRAGDAHESLMLMWQAARSGWAPPREVSEEDYAAERARPPSAAHGFVGFGCSFGGKWWGGYARGHDNYARAAARSVTGKGRVMAHAGADLRHCGFAAWDVSAGDVVYCDPPYRGTTGYAADFNGEQFWSLAREWSAAGAIVFVSEYQAPNGWEVVWERERRRHVGAAGGGSGGSAIERLFAIEGTFRAAPSQVSLFGAVTAERAAEPAGPLFAARVSA